MKLEQAIKSIGQLNQEAMDDARRRLDSIAKPLNSLGKLEKLIIKAAGIYGTHQVAFDKKCVVVMCGDNGVVDEGVAQVSREVTAIVAENMTRGMATVSIMAEKQKADVFVVDIGVAQNLEAEGIISRKIRYGTDNMAKGPAMSREEAVKAIETGIEIVFDLKAEGYQLIATGEMGIGNTTTSSAMTAVLMNKDAEKVTGRGAGLSSEGLKNKIRIIEKAIALNKPDPNDPIDVLSKVGGLDIAGLAGVFLGGAAARVPVLIDGFISSVAALTALKICPKVHDFMFASHISHEPAASMVLECIDLPHLLDCGMCLGEGTGAVAAFPLFDLAAEVYSRMSSFEDINIKPYKPLD